MFFFNATIFGCSQKNLPINFDIVATPTSKTPCFLIFLLQREEFDGVLFIQGVPQQMPAIDFSKNRLLKIWQLTKV